MRKSNCCSVGILMAGLFFKTWRWLVDYKWFAGLGLIAVLVAAVAFFRAYHLVEIKGGHGDPGKLISAGSGRKIPSPGSDVGHRRNAIRIVGSSTVFPYTKRVAKAYAKKSGDPAPLVETSGSSEGILAFCRGIGLQTPDIVNSSRPMSEGEWEWCKEQGVDDITEIYFGNDGISLIQSKTGKRFNLNRLQLYKATAWQVPVDGKLVDNPYRKWSDIDAMLPDTGIQIFGPTNSHGTYDTFVKNIVAKACEKDLFFFQLKRNELNDPMKFKAYLKANCSQLRFDGAYIAADQPLEQTLKLLAGNRNALALVGYADVFNRRATLQAVKINGVEPRIYTISDGSYALSRPLFFYIKNAHRELIPGITAFATEFMSEQAMGSFGYLVRMGLGVLPVDKLDEARYAAIIGTRMRRYGD